MLIWQFEPFLNLLTSYNVGNDGNLTNPVKSRLCEHNQPQAGGHTKLLRYWLIISKIILISYGVFTSSENEMAKSVKTDDAKIGA